MSQGASEERSRRQLSDWVIRRLSLKDIRLFKLSTELHSAKFELPLTTSKALSSYEFERQSGVVVYELSYEFSTQDKFKQQVWDVSFTLGLSFGISNSDKIGDEHLMAFGAHGVVDIAHPYARELVHQMTARMTVPMLLLEVLPPPWLRSDPA